jgi:eukaryotic-like serine/threonine-protein kinase
VATATVNPPTSAPQLPTPGIGSTQVSEKDGMVMVFVPAGEFTMGSDDGLENEQPVHTVTLTGFWIDQTEVTNALFSEFVEETQYQTDAEKAECSYVVDLATDTWNCVPSAVWNHPGGQSSDLSGLEMHPVVQVSWNDATSYCGWAGRRLPTEAEWEKAARGEDGRIYPWGDEPITSSLINFADIAYGTGWAVKTVDDGYTFTSPVGSFPDGKSPYGAYDMGGNVWEWVSSLFEPYPYNVDDGREEPGSEGVRGLRGGSWDDVAYNVRTTIRFRGKPTFTVSYTGFRCAVSP